MNCKLLLLSSLIAFPTMAVEPWAKVRNADDVIVETLRQPDGYDAGIVAHKYGPGFEHRLIPFVYDTSPVFDPATETIVLARVIGPTQVRVTKTTRALTSAELNEVARVALVTTIQADLAPFVAKLNRGEDLAASELRTVLLSIMAAVGVSK